MKTIKFFASLGINEGYFHTNTIKDSPTKIVGEIWQENAKKEFETSGIYVGAVICNSKTVYNVDWGCPIGGETTVLITGEYNPNFYQKSNEKWKQSAINVLKNCSLLLKQSTAQITFVECDFHYIKNT